ncbi:MAG: type IV toxin-antitoxin system AbiEi family antitoxin domain-containing protein [Polyangiaceae bacterium]
MILDKTAELMRLAGRGPVRARDLDAAKIPRAYLKRATERGVLEHVGRGLYRLPDAPVTELHALAEVTKRVPHATICLLSALQVHGLTTEAPHAVWIMIDTRARSPKLDTPALEVVRAHGAARTHGTSRRRIDGVEVSITTPAKTVADCFRYRRHAGLDVALAALRDYLQRGQRPSKRDASEARHGERDARRLYTIDALVDAARADRVYTVIRPYLEALA